MNTSGAIWGLLVEFESPEAILAGVRSARLAGYRRIEAYTPYAVEGLAVELGMKRSRIASICCCFSTRGSAFGAWLGNMLGGLLVRMAYASTATTEPGSILIPGPMVVLRVMLLM